MDAINSSQYIYDKLMEELSNGEMEPGQHLPAIPIAKKYGVSRTPVLEALRRMEADGIVVSYPGKGSVLISPSLQEVRDTFVVRSVLERKAVELAIANSDLVFFSRLKEAILAEDDLAGRYTSKSQFIKSSLAFHSIIAQQCKNALLEKYISNILSNIYVYQMLLYDFPTTFDDRAGRKDHERMLLLIEAGDVSRASTELERHIMEASMLL